MKLIAAVLLLAAAPSPEIRYFKYQRPVQVPQGASGQTCVALDLAAFEHAAGGLSDLRLYRGTTETPYVLDDADSVPTTGQPQTIVPVNAGRREGKTVFDAAMPEGAYSDVELVVEGRDFLATVKVFGGAKAEDTKTRIGTYNIFDFSQQKLGRSTVLHLPLSNFRWLHFEIDGPVGPEKMQGITAAREALGEPRYIAVGETSQLQQDGRNTVVKLSMPANVPVDRVVFAPPAAPVNFSRDVNVVVEPEPPYTEASSQREAPSAWTGNLLRIHRVENGRRIDEERFAVDSNVVTFRTQTKWTITVANGDDAPIVFSSVRLEMRERRLCFEVAAGATYTLYYGDVVLTAPHYDYGAWFTPRVDSAAAVQGAEAANAAYESRPDPRPFTERHPVLLWIALLAVIAVLAAIAFRSAKREPRSSAMP
jgi:hypothetical protein